MLYVFRLGFTYVAVEKDRVLAPVIAATDEAGLSEILNRAAGREVRVEMALRKAGRALGLRGGAAPAWALVPRAVMSTVLHLGTRLDPAAIPAVELALRAAAALVGAAPWSRLTNHDVLDIEAVQDGGGRRSFEGCVLGAGGLECGIALYDEPGSLARLAHAMERGALDEARRIDCSGLTIDAGPPAVAEAVEQAFGVPLAIMPVRLRGGELRPVSWDALRLLTGAALAGAQLTRTTTQGVATIEDDEDRMTVTVHVRAPRRAQVRPAMRRGSGAPAPPPATDVVATRAGDNRYCAALGIAVPTLEAVRTHAEAVPFSLLLVALLERGEPMTLDEVATRFDAAGVMPFAAAQRALRRCRPGRPPVYRHGDRYALDPHDHDLDLWAFRLGLRPARGAPAAAAAPAAPAPTPRPGRDLRLSVAELDEAWRDASLNQWSIQRLALAVLDAHDEPLTLDAVFDFVDARTPYHRSRPEAATFARRGAAVALRPDGRLEIVSGARELLSTRDAVRDAIERARRWQRPDPTSVERSHRAYEERRAAHAAELARLRRVIVHAFPARRPQAVALLDVATCEIATFVGDELAAAVERIAGYDVVAAVDVRGVLDALGIDPHRRLAELGPPQKSMRIGGRTLAITTALLVQSSCAIRRPFGDAAQLDEYLRRDQRGRLERRLEADVTSLFALHEYGRLHGSVRVRSGFVDEMLAAPWHHPDEPTLYHLMRQARTLDVGIDAVVGAAPGVGDRWSRARRLQVAAGPREHDLVLIGDDGVVVDDRDVQLARLAVSIH